MNAPLVKGWCPGALQPMMSGDGLLVRIRPPAGRLTAKQLEGIARLSKACGNGIIDFSRRANLQLRGIDETQHLTLIESLRELNLIDEDIASETRRNILVQPFWQQGDGTLELADELTQKLTGCPALPAKFGFAIDTGPTPVLTEDPADIRIERADNGELLVRADGSIAGATANADTAIDRCVELANWFVTSGGVEKTPARMSTHLQAGAQLPEHFTKVMAQTKPSTFMRPGLCNAGFMAGFEFGQATAEQLMALAEAAPAFRLTPWRLILLEGVENAPDIDGLIIDAEDPCLSVSACTGKPGCAQALAPTRPLAHALAPHVPHGTHLHVSGCAKGCARSIASDFTLTATEQGFALIRDGKASDTPVFKNLAAEEISKDPTIIFGKSS